MVHNDETWNEPEADMQIVLSVLTISVDSTSRCLEILRFC